MVDLPSPDELFDGSQHQEPAPSSGLIAPETAIIVSRVKEVIWAADATAPRSQQEELGPSELGAECLRQLAYKSAGLTPCNHSKDSWAANVGTAVHAWIEEAYRKADAGSGRYLVEETVFCTTPGGRRVRAHVDLIDRAEACIIDWKVSGANSAKRYRRKGTSPQYQAQLHVYGLCVKQTLGLTPKRVANVFLPRDGSLEDGIFGWSAPWDERKANEVLARYDEVATQARMLPLDVFWSVFEPTPGMLCSYCPFHNPGAPDATRGCKGE